MCILLLIPAIVYEFLFLVLDASGSHFLLLLLEIPLAAACMEARFRRFPVVKTTGSLVRISIYSLTAIFLVGYIIIISDTMYQGWFKLLIIGRPNGIVSFIFSFTAGFFTSLGCSWIILWKHKLRALTSMLLLINLVVMILFPGIYSILPFSILVCLYMFMFLPKAGRNRFILYGLLIIVFSAAVSWVPPIKKPEARGSVVIDGISRVLRTGLLNILPHLPLTFNIPGYGHPYSENRFTGARPYLTNHVLFVAEAERGTGLYLKTDISYYFNGTAWAADEPTRLINPPLSANDLSLISGSAVREISLTVVTDLFPRIPMTQETFAVRVSNTVYPLPADKVVEPPDGIPLGKGESITLFINPGSTIDTVHIDPKHISRALQLPSDTMKAFSLLAQSVRGENEIETLRNIRKYLTDGFIYTLDTTASSDPIADFLFVTKEGYCVHFSSAAAILARMNGIPVRIARGFMTVIPREKEQDIPGRFREQGGIPETVGISHITGFSSHQWPEIFIEGRGWVPWEVTPPLIGLADNNLYTITADDEITLEQLESLGILKSSGKDGSPDPGRILPFGKGYIALFVIIIMGLLLFIYLFLPRIRPLKVQISRSVRRLIKKSAKKLFVPGPEEIGWQLWGEKVSHSLYDEEVPLQELISGLIIHFYHPQGLTKKREISLLRNLRHLHKVIRRTGRFRV
ncbi:MAG: transglutaminase domain-containing protein [Bacteroidetes bacterium]|nr:transglutaminase domain-containing protein [Bacteroidota bacterium]